MLYRLRATGGGAAEGRGWGAYGGVRLLHDDTEDEDGGGRRSEAAAACGPVAARVAAVAYCIWGFTIMVLGVLTTSGVLD